MTVYKNSQEHAPIRSLEFSSSEQNALAFFHLDSAASKEAVKAQLQDAKIGQHIVAETEFDGHPVLITSGRHKSQLLEALGKQNIHLEAVQPIKKTDPWVIRSVLGFGGQILQLISSVLRPRQDHHGKGPFAHIDPSVFVFAVANLAANAINLIYRAQDVPDPHRLNFLKQQVNDTLGSKLAPGETPIAANDQRLLLRDPEHYRRNAVKGFHGFMQKNSVNVGELGLRYIGAFGLAVPLGKDNRKLMLNGKLPEVDKAPLRVYAGLSSIAGKTVALSSKVPDPYNPKPKSWLDNIREKLSFKLGGWIETVAFGALAYDNFFNTTPARTGEIIEKNSLRESQSMRGIEWNGKPSFDWIGGAGASMFVAGYVARHWAKYGKRHINMSELYAHAGDTLAKLPAEKLPQALADTAAKLAEDFKDDPKLDYATIYSALADDLCRYHPRSVAGPAGMAMAAVQAQSEPINQPGTRVNAATATQLVESRAPCMAAPNMM